MNAAPALTAADLLQDIDAADIALLPRDRQERFAALLAALNRRASRRKFFDLFPDNDNPQAEGIIYARSRYPKHIEFFKAGATYRERAFIAANRVGKAQPNDEPVLTPRGFVPMGSLRIGDEVIGSDGQAICITGVFPQGQRDIVRLRMGDGSVVRCDRDHLWTVRPVKDGRLAPFITVKASEIAERIERGERLALPKRPVVEFDQKYDLPVDPYLLGLLIGDGGISTGTVLLTTTDQEIIDYCTVVAPEYGCEFQFAGVQTWRFKTKVRRGGRHLNMLAALLEGLGLRWKGSHTKRIPAEYLTASTENRIALLRGLMDTDGSCSTGARSYYSVSEALCRDVAALARSLGINASVAPKNGRYNGNHHLSWKVHLGRTELSVFSLPRKKANEIFTDRTARGVMIDAVEPSGVAECTCISVDAADALYVTTDFVLTHNTVCGGYETTAHLTGIYPDWWQGKRFDAPVKAWACGKKNETTRDIVQYALLGEVTYETDDGRKGFNGKGMIPLHLTGRITWKRGVDDLVDTVLIKHISGGWSRLGLKSYEQGRGSFEGTAQHVIWLDEECPLDVYGECLIRTATTGGITMLTFTPLDGLTETVMQFMPGFGD